MGAVAGAVAWWWMRAAPPSDTGRLGIVRSDRKVLRDETGIYHPLGCTFFWAMQGWRSERERTIKHLDYLAGHKVDDLRILGEVDWDGRDIDPEWPDYEEVMGGFVDAAYQRGMRTQITLTGGKQAAPRVGRVIERVTRVVKAGREHKVFGFEIVNEYDRLDKMTMPQMEAAVRKLRALFPNHLIALSRPRAKDSDHDDSGFGAMQEAMERSGANLFWLHPRRSDLDFGWSSVRQAYDFHHSKGPACNGEPQGPQSSVKTESRPLQLAMARALTIICGGARYVFHPGHMVTGRAEPKYGRPDNLWEVPGIDAALRAVRGVDALLPDGVENWTVVNNGRSAHPLPLPSKTSKSSKDGASFQDAGFWEGSGKYGRVNKNYAAVSPDGRFVIALLGVKSQSEEGLTPVGTARRSCEVEVYDPVSGELVEQRRLNAGADLVVPGRKDTQRGYIVLGTVV